MKQNKLITAILGIALFLVYNNSTAQSTNSSNLTAVKKAIEKTNILYFDLFAQKDTAIVNLYTDDACLLSPNMPPICGKKALEKDFGDTFAAGQVKGVKFQTGEVYGDGKGYITEEGTWQVFDPNGKLLDDGKYLKLWRATKDGWKIFRDLFNSNHKAQ
ncbi:YybH family protein [Mucilaginibacter sp. X4EP1]|uniref:YybH family protein n=1 Tax=Mucilaginibacter sp. X4EP1 TaxID=2723092 RepID=UPI0021695DAF|nr:ketosteroid isomerase family protein [Mucilaginibacter sp. X4EP1]MCS3816269.1 ketosteroid isomerase-like protein [Mucilaginibacter sp. X4EP1]